MKQTAVEWLGLYIKGITTLNCDDIINQAKEMEKEQVINAHLTGLIHPLEMESSKQSEQYYNDNFGGL